MTTDVAPEHGMPDDPDEVEALMERLGIRDHTDEDCRISAVLFSAYQRKQPSITTIIVDGENAWLGDDEGWMHYRIDAGTRRRLMVGTSGEIALQPWST